MNKIFNHLIRNKTLGLKYLRNYFLVSDLKRLLYFVMQGNKSSEVEPLSPRKPKRKN